jgi:signal transduction histidine kinase
MPPEKPPNDPLDAMTLWHGITMHNGFLALAVPTALTAFKLFINAVRYGKGKPVKVSYQKINDKAVISIKDHGPGIAIEDQQRIFERFERAVDTSAVTGLGLGLFIVRNIVEIHHGAVKINSELGQGAEFVVELPIN